MVIIVIKPTKVQIYYAKIKQLQYDIATNTKQKGGN
jgi:hypothetical protein